MGRNRVAFALRWTRTAAGNRLEQARQLTSLAQLRADALLDLLIGDGIAAGGPLGHHAGGLPGAAGQPPEDPPPDEAPTAPAEPEPAEPEPAAAVDGDTGQEWDPAWPAEPYEPIGPHDVHPNPHGPPASRHDSHWHAFDGPELWPADWPGRWWHDPAVAAVAGHRKVAGPASPASPGGPAAGVAGPPGPATWTTPSHGPTADPPPPATSEHCAAATTCSNTPPAANSTNSHQECSCGKPHAVYSI